MVQRTECGNVEKEKLFPTLPHYGGDEAHDRPDREKVGAYDERPKGMLTLRSTLERRTKNLLTDRLGSSNLRVPQRCRDTRKGTMEPRKEWLRKPQYNPPTSQEKAGFGTYSFLKAAISIFLLKKRIAGGND